MTQRRNGSAFPTLHLWFRDIIPLNWIVTSKPKHTQNIETLSMFNKNCLQIVSNNITIHHLTVFHSLEAMVLISFGCVFSSLATRIMTTTTKTTTKRIPHKPQFSTQNYQQKPSERKKNQKDNHLFTTRTESIQLKSELNTNKRKKKIKT